MDGVAIASIIVAVVSALAAYASQRSSSKAISKVAEIEEDGKRNKVAVNARVDMERDAYIRARNFDMETIARQETEIKDLRLKVEHLEAEVNNLRNQLREKS